MTELLHAVEREELPRLRRRIALAFALAWFIGLGSLLALALVEGNARRRDALDTELALRATVIYGLAWFDVSGSLHPEILEREPWAQNGEFPMRVLVADSDRIEVTYGPTLSTQTLDELTPAIDQVFDGVVERWQGDAGGSRVQLIPMFADESAEIVGVAMVSRDREPLARELWGYFGLLLSTFVLLALLGLWVSFRLSTMSVTPLVDMFASRSRFIARAAHELRTPMTTVRSIVESARAGDELPERSLERIGGVAEAASRRVDTLLWHARLSGGQAELRAEPTRLDLLVEQVLDDYPQATHNEEAVEAHLDPALIEVALRNLLENAARHADAGDGHGVDVQVDARSLTVSDQGPGFPPDFEPTARASRGRAGGVGLGLDIARVVAQMHGGELVCSNGPSGGARVGLSFSGPLQPR